MTARAVADVSLLGEACFHRFGFEYQVTLSQVSERALCAVLSIHFDRRNPEESERAGTCHDALVRELLEHGYPPYRGAPRTVDLLHEDAPVYWDVTRCLKLALDPHELIAPGRYVPADVRGPR
jgi:4-cresol dehydrogenase (hydroxylating)